MTPLVLLSAEGKRSSRTPLPWCLPALLQCANATTGYFARAHGYGSHRVPYRTRLDCSGILPMAHTYPWRYACATDGFKAVWLDGSETRETCYDGFKAVPPALKQLLVARAIAPATPFYTPPPRLNNYASDLNILLIKPYRGCHYNNFQVVEAVSLFCLFISFYFVFSLLYTFICTVGCIQMMFHEYIS